MRWPTERRWALWSAFLLVHLVLALLNLHGPGQPFGDVQYFYSFWASQPASDGQLVGITQPWVYPIGALGPVLIPALFSDYDVAWLVMVTALDAAAFALLTTRLTRRRALAGWFWIVALAALGPVALGRLDTVSVAFAVAAVVIVVARPWLASVLLTIGAWIKFWPAAVLVSVLVALRGRGKALIAAVIATAAIVAVAVVNGGHEYLLSFISEQSQRGLQIEAPFATPWLWAAAAHASGIRIYYDQTIYTFQVVGPGVATAAAVSTVLLVFGVLVCVALGVRAVLRRADAANVLAALSLALVGTLIAFDKVGSPQYQSWYAPVVMLGLLVAAGRRGLRRWWVPLALALASSAITQLIYPYAYDSLTSAHAWMVALITVRNLIELAILAWALTALWRMPRAVAPEAVETAAPAEGISP